MTIAAILAAIASFGTIASAVAYLAKLIAGAVTKSPAQQDSNIDAQIAQERQDAETTGRPI